MAGPRFAHRLLAEVFCLAALFIGGCTSSYTSETRIGGRPVAYQSTTEKAISCKVLNEDMAMFAIGQFTFTIDRTQVTWGQGQALALPTNWKRVDFIDKEDHIVVQVDGKPFGEIRPAA